MARRRRRPLGGAWSRRGATTRPRRAGSWRPSSPGAPRAARTSSARRPGCRPRGWPRTRARRRCEWRRRWSLLSANGEEKRFSRRRLRQRFGGGGEAYLVALLLEEIEDIHPGDDVEVDGDLVEQQDLRRLWFQGRDRRRRFGEMEARGGGLLTLKGWRSPMHIWTRRRCPSETLCIRHCRSMSSRSISLSRLVGSTPSTVRTES